MKTTELELIITNKQTKRTGYISVSTLQEIFNILLPFFADSHRDYIDEDFKIELQEVVKIDLKPISRHKYNIVSWSNTGRNYFLEWLHQDKEENLKG